MEEYTDTGVTGREDNSNIEITSDMVSAGVAELRDKHFGHSIEDIVKDIYLAMEIERRIIQ